MRIREILDEIELYAPLHWQESYDNSGLIIGRDDVACTGVLVCLDADKATIEKAIGNNINLIISHHPFIYNPIKSINTVNGQGEAIALAIKNDVNIYSAHTNMDAYINGVNGVLAKKIGLSNIEALNDERRFEDEDYLGIGAIGSLEESMSREEFFLLLKEKLGLDHIRYNSNQKSEIKKVAFCGGSGSFLIGKAIEKEADIFITGDIKYHDFLDSEPNILIADIGHFESEQFIKEKIIAIISRKFSNFAPLISDDSSNRVRYF